MERDILLPSSPSCCPAKVYPFPLVGEFPNPPAECRRTSDRTPQNLWWLRCAWMAKKKLEAEQNCNTPSLFWLNDAVVVHGASKINGVENLDFIPAPNHRPSNFLDDSAFRIWAGKPGCYGLSLCSLSGSLFAIMICGVRKMMYPICTFFSN